MESEQREAYLYFRLTTPYPVCSLLLSFVIRFKYFKLQTFDVQAILQKRGKIALRNKKKYETETSFLGPKKNFVATNFRPAVVDG